MKVPNVVLVANEIDQKEYNERTPLLKGSARSYVAIAGDEEAPCVLHEENPTQEPPRNIGGVISILLLGSWSLSLHCLHFWT